MYVCMHVCTQLAHFKLIRYADDDLYCVGGSMKVWDAHCNLNLMYVCMYVGMYVCTQLIAMIPKMMTFLDDLSCVAV